MDGVTATLFVCGVLILIGYVTVCIRPKKPEPRWTLRIVCSDAGFTKIGRKGDSLEFEWNEVVEVAILTNDLGPFAEDVFLEVGLVEGSTYEIGADSPGFKDLLARFQELPGFDNFAVTRAMSCTDNARFPCWSR